MDLETCKIVANKYYDYLGQGCNDFALSFVCFDDLETSAQNYFWSEYVIEGTREIKNLLNDFISCVYRLHILEKIISEYDEDSATDLRFEFTKIPLHYCLLKPYEYAERVRHFATHICHQANRIVHNKKDKLSDDSSLNLEDLEKELKFWKENQDLYSFLRDISNKQSELSKATDNYRNRSQHGSPRSLEIGFTGSINRRKEKIKNKPAGFKRFIQFISQYSASLKKAIKSDGSINEEFEIVQYGLGSSPPIQTVAMLPLLIKEGAKMILAHDAYINLVKEQDEAICAVEALHRNENLEDS